MPDEAREEFEIDAEPVWPDEDGRLEPIFLAGPMWIDFEEFGPLDETLVAVLPAPPLLVGSALSGEFELADPKPGADEPDEPPPPPHQRASATSLAGSLGVHLLTLLILVTWTSSPAGMAGAIPVQLVLEEKAAPPQEASSQPVADTSEETAQADNAPAAPAAVPPPEPPPVSAPPQAPTKVAAVAKPPKPKPPPQPKPVPTPAVATAAPKPLQQVAAVARPVPVAALNPLPAAANPAARPGRVPGSGSGHGDYLKYLVSLTRAHLDMLSYTFLAGRRGETILSVVVVEDGTIGRISVKRSSGYPDIDAKIEEMVRAVGRFPPVPDAFQKPAVELDFTMPFPDGIQH